MSKPCPVLQAVREVNAITLVVEIGGFIHFADAKQFKVIRDLYTESSRKPTRRQRNPNLHT